MSRDGPGGRFKPNDGDWVCDDCGNVNFARRIECNKCGVGKSHIVKKDGGMVKKGGSEIGKQMAEKSKGLFSADDWQCKSCGNVNWARRMTCNVCNTPKYGKVEQRTGYGGGYMERDEVVEYKTAKEDDCDYDEFGRLKKGRRGKIDLSKSIIEDKSRSPVDDDDDDDEDGDVSKYQLESDDEDGDGDLSKYDLSDSDNDSKSNSKSKKISRSRSRSRSTRSSSRSRSRSRSRSSSSSSSDSRSRSRSKSREKRRRSYSDSRSRSRSRSPKSRRQK